MHAEDTVLADAFQTHRLHSYIFSGSVKDQSRSYCTDLVLGSLNPCTGLQSRGRADSASYHLFVQNRHSLPSRNFCANDHFPSKTMVWGSPLVSTAEYMNYEVFSLFWASR